MTAWKRIILTHTGMTEDDFRVMSWEQGVSFLELMESDNQPLLAKLMRNRLYWNWWNKQIGLLCLAWIKQRGMERISSSSTAHNRTHLQDYLDICRVHDNGMVSYSYLVEELIGPKGKQ